MKKYFAVTMIIAGMLVGSSALAATMSLSPASLAVNQGQRFNLTVSVNPQGVAYTAELKLNFPASLLKVESFTFANAWMPLSQAGYDLIDNTNGVLIKTAGYPKGVSSAVAFGTITFSAKKSGTGTISVADGSLILNASNANTLSGQSSVNVSISTPAAKTPAPSASPALSPSVSPALSASPVVSETPAVVVGQQASILSSIFTLGTGNNWMGLVTILIILALIAIIYWIVRKLRKPEAL